MAKMIAVDKCYVNDRLYQPGEEFEYDGPEGRAFHKKQGGKPLPPIDIDGNIARAAATKKKEEEVKLAEKDS